MQQRIGLPKRTSCSRWFCNLSVCTYLSSHHLLGHIVECADEDRTKLIAAVCAVQATFGEEILTAHSLSFGSPNIVISSSSVHKDRCDWEEGDRV